MRCRVVSRVLCDVCIIQTTIRTYDRCGIRVVCTVHTHDRAARGQLRQHMSHESCALYTTIINHIKVSCDVFVDCSLNFAIISLNFDQTSLITVT